MRPMRRLAKLKTAPFFRTGNALAAKLGLGIFILGLAGPAQGGREAPAVWVPLAPGAEVAGNSGHPPTVLVPWFPEYLAAPASGSPGQDLLGGAVRSGVLPRDVQPPPGGATGAVPFGSGRSLTLSDVLRDVDWHRHTAKRLRQAPGFKPKL